MKAAIIEQSGGSEVLELADIKQPKINDDGQVLVKLEAAGINPIDTKVRSNPERFPITMPAVLGCDGAGIVEAVGSSVTKFQPGDDVYFYQCGFGEKLGTYAEYAVVDESLVAPKPNFLDFQHAAAAPLVLITAWEALHDRVAIQAGQSVFIPGGAGGVGHVAIQLAKLAGAKVCTTVSTAEKEAFVKTVGASKVIRYQDENVVRSVRDWTEGEGVDIAFDTLGDSVFGQCCACTRLYGDVVTILQPPDGVDWSEARTKNLSINLEMMLAPVMLARDVAKQRQGEILRKSAELFDAEKLSINVAKTFALEKAGDAHRCLESDAPMGKVVLDIW